jgi:hypothetical protein
MDQLLQMFKIVNIMQTLQNWKVYVLAAIVWFALKNKLQQIIAPYIQNETLNKYAVMAIALGVGAVGLKVSEMLF